MIPLRPFPKLSVLALFLFLCATHFGAEPSTIAARPELAELDAFWREVSRSVQEGNFEAYKATCHPTGVLVNGISKKSHPLSEALARWKPGFDDTKAGRLKASVEFRFSQRLGDRTTAHETGIFRYTTETPDGKRTDEFIRFESLLIKEGRWLSMMEYQKSKATQLEWESLSSK